MEKQNTYLIYDLGCTAAIISSGINVFDLDRTNPNRVGFVFEYSSDLQELIDLYWSKKLKVDARTLVENTKMLKTRIYSEK